MGERRRCQLLLVWAIFAAGVEAGNALVPLRLHLSCTRAYAPPCRATKKMEVPPISDGGNDNPFEAFRFVGRSTPPAKRTHDDASSGKPAHTHKNRVNDQKSIMPASPAPKKQIANHSGHTTDARAASCSNGKVQDEPRNSTQASPKKKKQKMVTKSTKKARVSEPPLMANFQGENWINELVKPRINGNRRSKQNKIFRLHDELSYP